MHAFPTYALLPALVTRNPVPGFTITSGLTSRHVPPLLQKEPCYDYHETLVCTLGITVATAVCNSARHPRTLSYQSLANSSNVVAPPKVADCIFSS